jgi:hypothetical protein
MKNIKYLLVFFLQLTLIQLITAQTTDDKGRPVGTQPGPIAQTASTTSNSNNNSNTDNDQDDPNAIINNDGPDIFYPGDLEEVMASTNMFEVIEKINEMGATIDDMRLTIEELRLENQVIRESLSNCCSTSALGLSASDAYLIQNAPNPFNESAEIRYFVPGGLTNVEIRITDVKGDVLDVYQINEAGYGKLEVNADALASGTFVYLLSVDNEIIDSKVMIITQ